jgi:hypothetical protein
MANLLPVMTQKNQYVENGANGAPASLKITRDMALAIKKTELKQGSVLQNIVRNLMVLLAIKRSPDPAIQRNAKSISTIILINK